MRHAAPFNIAMVATKNLNLFSHRCLQRLASAWRDSLHMARGAPCARRRHISVGGQHGATGGQRAVRGAQLVIVTHSFAFSFFKHSHQCIGACGIARSNVRNSSSVRSITTSVETGVGHYLQLPAATHGCSGAACDCAVPLGQWHARSGYLHVPFGL